MTSRPSPRFNSILVSVTEGCHVGCAHCGFRGSVRDREAHPDDLADWVAQACRYGIATIIFTGGEAFERFEVLETGVAAAKSENTPSAVFTSSFWGTSRDAARAKLARLSGLEHLYLSTDVYHQRRVPYEYVWNVIDAADDLAIPKISIVITYARTEDLVAVKSRYARYGDRLRICEERVIPTPFISAALKNQDPLLSDATTDYDVKCWLDTPIVNPNGDIFACHVGKAGAHARLHDVPYWLGNLRSASFDAIMASAKNRADYQYLRTHGPQGVAALYERFDDLRKASSRSGFTSGCDMCFSTLTSPQGREALYSHVQDPDVLLEINLRLTLLLREPALDPQRITVGPPADFGDAGATRRDLALPVPSAQH